VPAWLKRQAYAEYGITQYKTGDYEVDHLIPLSLGGCAGKMMSFLSGALIAGPIGHRPDPIFADLSEIGVGFAEFERDLLRERVRAGIAPRPKNEADPLASQLTPERCRRKSSISLPRGVSKRQISQRARHRAQLGSASHPQQRESEMARGGLSLAVILRLNLAGSKGPAMRPLLSEKCLQRFYHAATPVLDPVRASPWLERWERCSHTVHAGPLVVHQHCMAQIALPVRQSRKGAFSIPSASD
jgi:hypothetical protein